MGSAERYIQVRAREVLYRFGPFELSDAERVLRRDGRLMSLPPKAFAALSVLVKAEGKVVSKTAMLAAVWPDTFVEEGVLTQTISILRRQLSVSKTEESPIETISRVGYRLRLPVSMVGDEPAYDTAASVDAAADETASVSPDPPAALFVVEENAGASAELPAEHNRFVLPGSSYQTTLLVVCLVIATVFAFSYVRASQGRTQQAAHTQGELNTSAPGLAFPRNQQAKRLYIEGIQKLRSWDSVAAAHSLEASVALEPDFPLSHVELAHAVTLLGQSERALQEAHRGRDLSAHLSRIDQLRVQAICEATEHRFEAAAATYGTLFALVPQDLEYARSQASLLENAGHNKEGIDLLEPLLKGPSQGSVTSASELVIGQGYSNIGDHSAAQKWAKRAEDDAKGRGDLVLYERALTAEAYALASLHQPEPALQKAKQASELADKLEDEAGTLQAILATAQIKTGMGMLHEAQLDLQRALSQAEASRQVQKQIFALDALGRNYSRMGDEENALLYYQRGATLARSFGLPETQHRAQFNVANEELKLGRRSEARHSFSQLLDEAISSGDKPAAQRAKQALLNTAGS